MEKIIEEIKKRIEFVERHSGLLPKQWEAKETKKPKKK